MTHRLRQSHSQRDALPDPPLTEVLKKFLQSLVFFAVLASTPGCHSTPIPTSVDGWVTGVENLQYFAVLVEDVDVSIDWYRKIFSLRNVGGSKADDGSWRIENLENDDPAIEIIYDKRAQNVNRSLGFRKVGFQVTNVDAVADRIAQETGERPTVVDFAQTRMPILQIRDPDGNTIQLFSRLESP